MIKFCKFTCCCENVLCWLFVCGNPPLTAVYKLSLRFPHGASAKTKLAVCYRSADEVRQFLRPLMACLYYLLEMQNKDVCSHTRGRANTKVRTTGTRQVWKVLELAFMPLDSPSAVLERKKSNCHRKLLV